MKTTYKTVTVNNHALAALIGVPAGGDVQVACNRGTPVKREWRNRFNDAPIDGCITIQQNTPKPRKTEAK